MREELSKKSAKLIDDYINGRIELTDNAVKKLKAQLNLCIQELEDLVWNMTCDPSQYPKLKKRLDDYYKLETDLNRVVKFYKELEYDKNRKEFYKVGTQDQEELPIMKMKLISVKKDAYFEDPKVVEKRKAETKAAFDQFKKRVDEVVKKIEELESAKKLIGDMAVADLSAARYYGHRVLDAAKKFIW